jgi:creatinine amidohydrolase/Fe(II)-dependent formamide hydrolase-like protein
MPILRAEELSYAKIHRLVKTRAIAFLPVSALEVHGPHLPLGMDQFMARWMAEEAGRRFAERHPDWTIVHLPLLSLGADEIPLAGSIEASPATVFRSVLAHGRGLVRAGFENVVVTNGHGGPRHAAALEAACRRISRRFGVRMFTPSILTLHRIVTGQRFARVEELLGRTLEERERTGLSRGEHAGAWETSFMLAERASLVEPEYSGLGDRQPPVWAPLATAGDRIASWRERRGADTKRFREGVQGIAGGLGWVLNARFGYGGDEISYKGDPSVASAEIGHAFREVLAEDCLALVEQVCLEGRPAAEVRSIASDHAVIQPGFLTKVGLAAAALLALVLLAS